MLFISLINAKTELYQMLLTKTYPSFLQKRLDYYENVVMPALSSDKSPFFLNVTPNEHSIFVDNNDYLSLANHPEIIETQINQLRIQDNSLMSSFFVSGKGPREEFEEQLAAHTNQEASILSTSGWDANTGLIQTIADKDTHIYMDQFVHASLHVGAQISGGIVHIFEHNNPEHLEKKIKEYGTGVVIVDSVYSSIGSVCPLSDIVEISKKYDCIVVVDESHSLGLYGKEGAGLVAELGLEEQVDFITASLSKTFCSRGGIITCSAKFKNYFRHNSFPAIFSSVIQNHEAARFIKTLDIIKQDEWRREQLHKNTKYLHSHLDYIGFNTEVSSSPIISLEVNNESKAILLRDLLVQRNVVTAPFIPPAVPKKRCNTRMTVNCNLTHSQMQHIVKSCKEVVSIIKLSKDEVDQYREDNLKG
jgi:CAI-1 autoinducer synthase